MGGAGYSHADISVAVVLGGLEESVSTSEESFIGRRHLPLEPRAVRDCHATPRRRAAAPLARGRTAGGRRIRRSDPAA